MPVPKSHYPKYKTYICRRSSDLHYELVKDTKWPRLTAVGFVWTPRMITIHPQAFHLFFPNVELEAGEAIMISDIRITLKQSRRGTKKNAG